MTGSSRRLLFALTSSGNLGDLALCAEWADALASAGGRCAFACPADLIPFLPEREAQFPYEPGRAVGDTLLEACAAFRPDAVVFATGAFWSIPGQRGAEWGAFDPRLADIGIPLLSFDPLESGFACTVPVTGKTVTFPPVPDGMWSLRYMSMPGELPPRARRFRLSKPRDVRGDAGALLRGLGFEPDRPLIVYCVSGNRLQAVQTFYYDYYDRLADLLAPILDAGAQLLVLGTDRLAPLEALPHTALHPRCGTDRFFAILRAARVFLADSLVSSLAYACFAGVPSVLLCNEYASPAALPPAVRAAITPGRVAHVQRCLRRGACRLLAWAGLRRAPVPGPYSVATHGVFPWVVFPYGMTEMCRQADRTFAMAPCYRKAPFFDADAARRVLAETLADGPARTAILQSCRAWSSMRAAYPSPVEVLEDILAAGSGG